MLLHFSNYREVNISIHVRPSLCMDPGGGGGGVLSYVIYKLYEYVPP